MEPNIVRCVKGVGHCETAGGRSFPQPRLVEPILSPDLSSRGEALVAGRHPATAPTSRGVESPARPASAGLPVTGADPLVDRIADSRLSVVITGETGAGKEVLARALHARSPRCHNPLVAINCAALCDSLVESELFGHERGSFTGATQAKVGLVEAADGGTLFLDEVADLSLTVQAKLLRVIETRVVTRVGSVTPRTVDVRFVAATNCDLEQAVDEGRFREDLRFRLEGIRLVVPPLRERLVEIVPAALSFLREAAERDGRALPVLAPEAKTALLAHLWPGNFRELRNVMERAAVICADGRIEARDLLLSDASRPHDVLRGSRTRATVALTDERARILSALDTCAGNQTRAAKALGISRRTLITRLDALDIARPRARRLRVLAAG